MPHFNVECSDRILSVTSPQEIMQNVHQSALSTKLFIPSEIKVRINSFENYLVGGISEPGFIHVFANIMEGRNIEQKQNLSKQIVNGLSELFPDLEVISINIRDFEKSTYCNKDMI